jgi:dihydroorotase
MMILIKNGLIYTTEKKDKTKKDAGSSFIQMDILIENNKIKNIAKDINEDCQIIDAQGKYVFPGFIDLHTHLRDPGQTYKEDIYTGTRAAAKGGWTTVCAMPNTDPVVDNIATVEYIKRKATDIGSCKVLVIGAMTKKLEGKEIAEIANMMEGGIVAVSDDGNSIQSTKITLNAMKYISNFNIPIISHCEDYSLSGKGQINSGKMSTKLGLGGIPALAEELMISRDIMLAENIGCQLHIAHISTRRSIDLVRIAKAKGLKVTAEVTPHHLLMTEEACGSYDTNTKVKPPLRTEKDREACLQGLYDGTIDFIATDHAPHSDFEKEKEFSIAPFGINSLETAFAALYTELVLNNKVDLAFLIEKMSTAPAKFLNLNCGVLEVGALADITIADLDADIHFSKETMVSKSNNTPYLGKTLKGKVVKTICDGKIVYSG